jgi:hypothetical protein
MDPYSILGTSLSMERKLLNLHMPSQFFANTVCENRKRRNGKQITTSHRRRVLQAYITDNTLRRQQLSFLCHSLSNL